MIYGPLLALYHQVLHGSNNHTPLTNLEKHKHEFSCIAALEKCHSHTINNIYAVPEDGGSTSRKWLFLCNERHL